MNKLLWWGYLHTSGTLQAKRYFDELDIREAHESPFCKQVVGPFEASGRDEALLIVKNLTDENENTRTNGVESNNEGFIMRVQTNYYKPN